MLITIYTHTVYMYIYSVCIYTVDLNSLTNLVILLFGNSQLMPCRYCLVGTVLEGLSMWIISQTAG